jgi:hypothetical protein
MMTSSENDPTPPQVVVAEWTPQRRKVWCTALGVSLLLLAPLDWLLARLLWLPMYFGLFFFLVAGLLVGGVAFRMARSARPLTRTRIIVGILPVAFASICITVILEYRHIASIAGAPPALGAAWSAQSKDSASVGDIKAEAAKAFRSHLADKFPPGGVVGYARWAVQSGEMKITAFGFEETVTIAHQGLTWPIRTLAAFVLLLLGLWLSFESLRSPSPVSNIIAEGEEYEEIE